MALAIGEQAPDFSLPGVDGRIYTFNDLMGGSATVIIWWCNHCPFVIPNQDRVIAMQRDYDERGVRFAVICSNNAETYPEDSFANMKQRASAKGYNFPYLHDEGQDAARSYGAQRTPEVFLFDAERKLRYHGRIDDNHEDVNRASSHDLRNALEAVLSGQRPDPAETGA